MPAETLASAVPDLAVVLIGVLPPLFVGEAQRWPCVVGTLHCLSAHSTMRELSLVMGIGVPDILWDDGIWGEMPL